MIAVLISEPQLVANENVLLSKSAEAEPRIEKPTYAKAASVGITLAKHSNRVVGVADQMNYQCKLKSAKPYIKRAIYALYNVGNDETWIQ